MKGNESPNSAMVFLCTADNNKRMFTRTNANNRVETVLDMFRNLEEHSIDRQAGLFSEGDEVAVDIHVVPDAVDAHTLLVALISCRRRRFCCL